MRAPLPAALAALALGIAPAALAQDPGDPVGEGLIEQSCRSLAGGTAGAPDQVPADVGNDLPPTWPEAPPGLLPARIHLRTATESFNRLYEFATRNGTIYGRLGDGDGPWRELPLPLCFAGRAASISLDDDELVALDTVGRVYTMDNALKDASQFNWTSRWGTPVWTGPGYTLPRVKAWSWSVISPLEDKNWTDRVGREPAAEGARA